MAGDFSKAAQEYLMAARAFEGELKKGNPSVSIDAVISEYDGVLRIKPDNLESLLARGRLYYERHSNAEALSDFKKALGISPKNAQAYLYIGKIEASIMGEETYAEKNLKTASTLDPGNPEPHRALGDFYSGRFELPRRVDRASKEYLKAAQLEADPALASIDRANAFAAVGDLEKSLGEYSKAISFISSGQTRASSKQAAEIYIGRARLYESLGKPELAGKDRAKAGELWRQAPEEK
jgi:tetratricopeptide (TPR) repeat protein